MSVGTKAGPAEVPSLGSNCVGRPRTFIPAKRLTSAVRCEVNEGRPEGVHTGLRIEVLGIADLHRTRYSMNSRVVVDRILFCNLVGVYRGICLALGHMSGIDAVGHTCNLPS